MKINKRLLDMKNPSGQKNPNNYQKTNFSGAPQKNNIFKFPFILLFQVAFIN